jgi:tetratricopeptide (TPR) repeat protein
VRPRRSCRAALLAPARKRFVDRLSPAETRQLHHLLTCPLCGPAATLHIDVADGLRAPRRRKAPPPEPVPDPVEQRKAERLTAMLLSLPQGVRLMRVRNEPRYARPAVAKILLEASARAQPANPEDSYELAMLAVGSMQPGSMEQARPILQAELLMANAARLAGRLDEAETVLDRVAPFLIAPDLRGAFCRLRALVLWERGRLEEAHGLLRQAAGRFAEAGLEEEEGTSQALLGLLLREMGEGERCFAAMARALTLPFAERRPWLGVRVALIVAWVCSACETPVNAWPVVVWADRLLPLLKAPAEKAWAQWWHGRILLTCGEVEPARRKLLAARGQWLEHRRLAEAALTTLDLAATVPATEPVDERAAQVLPWIEEIEAAFAGEPGLDLVRPSLHGALHARLPETLEQRKVQELGLLLRFRLAGLRVDSLPFA